MAYITPNKIGGGRGFSGGVKSAPKGKGKGRDKEKPEPSDNVTTTEIMKGLALSAVGAAEHQGEVITNLVKKTTEEVKGFFAAEERDRNKNKNPDVFEAKRIKNAQKK
tara:strand:+ start:97 stop:420 length:324 start_codon:yes stop_codon:yes gene_type:complete